MIVVEADNCAQPFVLGGYNLNTNLDHGDRSSPMLILFLYRPQAH